MRKNSQHEYHHKYTIVKQIAHSSVKELYEELQNIYPTPSAYRQHIKSFSLDGIFREHKQLKGIQAQVTKQKHTEFFDSLYEQLKAELEYRMCTTEELQNA